MGRETSRLFNLFALELTVNCSTSDPRPNAQESLFFWPLFINISCSATTEFKFSNPYRYLMLKRGVGEWEVHTNPKHFHHGNYIIARFRISHLRTNLLSMQ